MRPVIIALAVFLGFGTALADTIVVDGVTYRDVRIRESGSRYYFMAPDGTAVSVSKDAISPRDIAFGSDPLPGTDAAPTPEIAEPEAAIPAEATPALPQAVALPDPAALQAGAATVHLLRAGLGGLEANALVLAAGGHRLGFVSLDLAAVDAALMQRIHDRLAGANSGLNDTNLVVAATGRFTQAQSGILQGPLEQALFGAYDREAAIQISAAAAEAVSAAENALAPASVRIAETALPGVHSSRGGDNASLDSTLTVLQANSLDGETLGYLVNFALYPAFAPGAAPLDGRGAPGTLDAALEAAAGKALTVVFLNGAAADTEPDFSRGESALGEELAAATLAALGNAEALLEAPLVSYLRRATLPPSLLHGLVPREAALLEAHLADAVFMTVPGLAGAQPGVLLRVKAMQGGKEHVFIAAHSGGFAGLFPSVDGFFLGEATEQSSFYGPLAGKWLAENYLPDTESAPPLWQSLPELAPHAGTFTEAMEAGSAEGEAIRARYEAVSQGLAKLTDLIRNAPAMLGDNAPPELAQFMPLLEALSDDQLQAVVKQLAAALFRSQMGDFTAEQRVRLMGYAEGAGIPFDAAILLQALSNRSLLPSEVQMFVGMAEAQGGDVTGYEFY